MLKFIREAVGVVGFGGAWVLLAAPPFLPPLRLLVFAFLLIVLTCLLILILNKLLFGVYTRPGMTPEKIDAIRQAVRQRRPRNSLLAVLTLVVVFPIIFLMTKFGWSQNSIRAVLLIVGCVLGLLFTVACVKYDQKRSRPP